MTLLRSALFNVFFFVATFVVTLALATPVRLAAPHRVLDVAQLWARIMVWAARAFCGIRVQVSGLERVGSGAGPDCLAPSISIRHVRLAHVGAALLLRVEARTAAHPAIRAAAAARRDDRGGS